MPSGWQAGGTGRSRGSLRAAERISPLGQRADECGPDTDEDLAAQEALRRLTARERLVLLLRFEAGLAHVALRQVGRPIRTPLARRFGKTSLLNAHIAAMRETGHRAVRIDLSKVATIADVAGRTARAYASLPAGRERVVDRVLARLGVTIGPGGVSLRVAGYPAPPRAEHARDVLAELSDGHPQRMMLLASHLLELTAQGHEAADLAAIALDLGLAETRDVHQGVWDGLRRADRAVLTALADGDPPTGERTAEEHHIPRASLQRALERLVAEEVHILRREGRPTFADPLLREWLARR